MALIVAIDSCMAVFNAEPRVSTVTLRKRVPAANADLLPGRGGILFIFEDPIEYDGQDMIWWSRI